MEYEKFIRKPSIDMMPGIVVTKDTAIEYKNEVVEQTIKDLVLHSKLTIEGEGYKSTQDTEIYLNEGDVLIFEDDSRGYIKPVETFMKVEEAINELNCIK